MKTETVRFTADTIQHNRPLITESDRAAVDAVLASGWIAEGAEVRGLENDFVRHLGGGDACAVSSGTAALFLALRGLGIGRGNRVAVPSYSCSALLNAVYMADASPWVVDVRDDDFTIDLEGLGFDPEDVRAAIAVHCFGATANVKGLKQRGLTVIEDCCQSLGGPQGRVGDAAIFSFYATKILTGGQGGLIWDRTGAVADWARDYREFDRRKTYVTRFNLQMTDVSAALVRSQFRRLNAIRERRRWIWTAYLDALPKGFTVQGGLGDKTTLPFRFVVRAPDGDERDTLSAHLANYRVSAIVPVERFELLHRYLDLDPEAFPKAEALAETTLSLPLYPDLRGAEVDRVVEALNAYR